MLNTFGGKILPALPFVLALMTGCGASPAKAPSEPAAEMPAGGATSDAEVSSQEASTVDEAAADFESAESSLEGMLTAGGDTDPAPPAPSPDGTPEVEQQGGQRYAAAGGRCTRACRALASMRRSADRLCSLTSPDDPRCVNVVDRLERAEERVKANCPSCSS